MNWFIFLVIRWCYLLNFFERKVATQIGLATSVKAVVLYVQTIPTVCPIPRTTIFVHRCGIHKHGASKQGNSTKFQWYLIEKPYGHGLIDRPPIYRVIGMVVLIHWKTLIIWLGLCYFLRCTLFAKILTFFILLFTMKIKQTTLLIDSQIFLSIQTTTPFQCFLAKNNHATSRLPTIFQQNGITS